MFQPLVTSKLAPRSSVLSQTSPQCTVIAISFTFELRFQRFSRSRDPCIVLYIFSNFSSIVFTVFLLFLICIVCSSYVIVQTTCHSTVNKSKLSRKIFSSQPRKASSLLPLHTLFYPSNIILIHFTLLLYCINLMGQPLRIYLVFSPKPWNTRYNFVGQNCLDALSRDG